MLAIGIFVIMLKLFYTSFEVKKLEKSEQKCIDKTPVWVTEISPIYQRWTFV